MPFVTMVHKGEEHQVPKDAIRKFAQYLETILAYKPANIDVQISMTYSGNKIAVREFFDWYEKRYLVDWKGD